MLKRLDRRRVNSKYGKLVISRVMIDTTFEVMVMTENGEEIEQHTFTSNEGIESYYCYIRMVEKYI